MCENVWLLLGAWGRGASAVVPRVAISCHSSCKGALGVGWESAGWPLIAWRPPIELGCHERCLGYTGTCGQGIAVANVSWEAILSTPTLCASWSVGSNGCCLLVGDEVAEVFGGATYRMDGVHQHGLWCDFN